MLGSHRGDERQGIDAIDDALAGAQVGQRHQHRVVRVDAKDPPRHHASWIWGKPPGTPRQK
jgi:hypothetical protein